MVVHACQEEYTVFDDVDSRNCPMQVHHDSGISSVTREGM